MQKPSYQIHRTANVLWVQAYGITTMRDVQDYLEDFRTTIQPVMHQPWACVMDMRRWQPSPAEQFAALRENTTWCMQNNLRLAIVLLPADPLLAWQFVQTTAVEKREDFLSVRAKDDEDTLAILQHQGFLLQDHTDTEINREVG
jgi:hypothetical protein